MSTKTRFGIIALTTYIAAIVAANWVTNRYGLVPVGFGITATAGTYFAGCALMLRNVVQDALGRKAVAAAILFGALVSMVTSSAALGIASGVAFGASELLDMTVYTPLRSHGWARAVIPASLVGALVDTFLFLYLAGFPVTTSGVLGQLVSKTWAVWFPVAVVVVTRTIWHSVGGGSDPVLRDGIDRSGA